MRLTPSLKIMTIAGLLSATMLLGGCQGGTTEQAPAAPNQTTSTGGLTTTSQAPAPAPKGTPTGPVNAQISPAEVAVGNFVMTVVVDPAQHMFDLAKEPDSDAVDEKKAEEQQNGIAVLGGMMLKVTNNIDAAQNPQGDSPQGEVLRHVAIQLKDSTTGQLVPYLAVSMDALRDGRPALSNQSLVPELVSSQDVSQMRYGNNVRFPRKGTYQLFIRIEANPILGSEVPPAAQFNLTLD